MKTFELTVLKMSRLNIVFVVLVFTIVGGVFISLQFDNLFWKIAVPLFLIVTINAMTFYSSFCQLTISVVDNILRFQWKDKLLFNFEPISEIAIEDIHTLIIDRDEYESTEVLLAIITDRTKVLLGAMYKRKDANLFIQFLKESTNARIRSRWEQWRDRGYLRTIYVTINIGLIMAVGILIWILVNYGYEKLSDSHWLILVCSFLGLIGQQRFIKNKMK